MKRKVKEDKEKARGLYKTANITLERLNSFNKLKYPSNTLQDYYNILHQLNEAISSVKGIKFSGDYAHKELIDWICGEIGLTTQDNLFLQRLRLFRNKISYEGFLVQSSFIKQNEKKILEIINRLNKLLQKLF